MKVLLIEDEPAAARRLEKLLLELDPEIEILAHLEGIRTSVLWFQSNPEPDIIFMDIHLSDGPCFEIFKAIDLEVPIIFTTAYDKYALKAFEVNSVDYLLKPINREKLSYAWKKFRKRGQNSSSPIVDDNLKQMMELILQKPEERLTVRIGSKIIIVYFKEIAYCYTSDKITFISTHQGKRYPVDLSLENLEMMLDSRKYFRINRQFIVGIDAIQEMYTYSKSRVRLSLKPSTELETIVSVERSPKFKSWLEGN